MTLHQQVAIVTDSAADLPLELAKQYGIHIVLLYLTMDRKTWRDGVDISPGEFYKLLQTSKDFPKTSQPNAASFEELFRSLSQKADAIVAILVSRQLSGTISSAEAARISLPDFPIEIINTGGVSMMEGF